MKNLTILSLLSLFLYSCEEVPPFIDFSEPQSSLLDTTFIETGVILRQHKMVLLEDITGVRCQNCPAAAATAQNIYNQKTSDSVVVLALYPFIPSLENFTKPYTGEKDLTTIAAKQIVDVNGLPAGLPNGYINRKLFNGRTDKIISPLEWINFVNQELKTQTPVNIELSKSLTGNELTATISLLYSDNLLSSNHSFSLLIMEDGIVSKQKFPTSDDPNYTHNHVLRYAFGNATGNNLNAPLVHGRKFIKAYKYDIPSSWDISKCYLIGIVTDNTTNEVINVRKIKL